MKFIPNIRDLNDAEERRCNLLIIEKLKYSSEIYTVEEITKLLNPYGQESLTKLSDIANEYKHISITEMAKVLWKWGYINVFNNICYSRKPRTYNYIIPILKNGRLVDFDEEIVLTIEVENKLRRYCYLQPIDDFDEDEE